MEHLLCGAKSVGVRLGGEFDRLRIASAQCHDKRHAMCFGCAHDAPVAFFEPGVGQREFTERIRGEAIHSGLIERMSGSKAKTCDKTKSSARR